MEEDSQIKDGDEEEKEDDQEVADAQHWKSIENIEWKKTKTNYSEKDNDFFNHEENQKFQQEVERQATNDDVTPGEEEEKT